MASISRCRRIPNCWPICVRPGISSPPRAFNWRPKRTLFNVSVVLRATLHDRLAKTSRQTFAAAADGGSLLSPDEDIALPTVDMGPLLDELNAIVYEALGVKHR